MSKLTSEPPAWLGLPLHAGVLPLPVSIVLPPPGVLPLLHDYNSVPKAEMQFRYGFTNNMISYFCL
jgi:hypothetical protein